MHKAIFIDRDGVITQPVFRPGKRLPTAPYKREELKFCRGIRQALRMIKDNHFLSILITNQPDIRYGNMTSKDWEDIQKSVSRFPFDDSFVCFHGRDDGCACKKPKPGLLLAAQKKWQIDFSRSYMIGDTKNDMQAGKAVGCVTICIDAAYNADVESDLRAKNLRQAIQLVIARQ